MKINDENYKPKFYSTHQVSGKLNIEDSNLRFYCDKFKDFLDIKREGRNRKFTEENIESLRFILKLLKEKGFSIKQAIEYLSKGNINTANSTNNNSSNDFEMNEQLLNKLAKQIVSEVLKRLEFDTKLEKLEEEILSHFDTKFDELNNNNEKNSDKIIQLISSTLEKLIDEKLNKLDVYYKLKVEQEKNKQLETLILELYNNKNTEEFTNAKKVMKKNLFDTFR